MQITAKFKLLLLLSIRKLPTKHDTLLSQTRSIKPKIPHSLTTNRSVCSLHLTSIMPQRKGVKSSARATITNSEQEGLPDNDPIDIVRIPS